MANDNNVPKIQIGRIVYTEMNAIMKILIKIANTLNIKPKKGFTVHLKKQSFITVQN